MRILRYIVLLLVFLVGADMWGQYNPTNPTEPGDKPWKLTLRSIPDNAGSFNRDKVTSWGAGTKVSITANNNGNYIFQRWENEDGTIASENASFSIVMPETDVVLVARYTYNPSNPDEPSTPAKYATITIDASPADGGYTNPSGTNKYQAGSKVTLNAYNYSDFTFVNWTENGQEISTSSTLSNYEVKEEGGKLIANFRYAPGSPGEPAAAVLSHPLYLKSNPDGACTFNFSSGTLYKEGTSVDVRAYANSYYTFKNWTFDGEVISNSSEFNYEMPKRAATLVANYSYNYNPDNPDEPGIASTDRHHLYGMHENGIPGQTIKYPIYLENTRSVTGFSIDIAFPVGLVVDANNATLTERASGHTIEVQDLGNNSFRFFIRGSETFLGANGKVLEIPLKIPVTEEVGTIYTIGLSKGAVFKADGSQTVVTVRSGSLKIQQSPDAIPDSPDFTISDINVNERETGPGEMIHLSWKVNNIGQLEAASGWSERIYLVSSTGKKVNIGTTYYETNQMEAGMSVSREADIALGRLLGIEGETYISMTIVPNAAAGEIEERQGNNTTDSKNTTIQIKKLLYLTLPTNALTEGNTTSAKCQLARSGNWTSTEVFNLNVLTGDSRLQVPATVSIPKDQSSVYFYITVENNTLLDESTHFTIQATGNGYPAVSSNLEIIDDEEPGLIIKSSKSEVAEGDSFELTISIPRVSTSDVMVNLVAEYPKRFTMPSQIIIPAGQTSAKATVSVINDDIPSIQLSNAFTVSAEGYTNGEVIVILNDDDIPALELTLTPNRVAEGAGVTAVAGILRRTGKTDNKITVKLTDNANGGLYFGNRTLELAKGVEEIHFNFGPVDNTKVDGDRNYTITAAVWVSSCNCSAAGEAAGSVTANLEVFDDDGATLSITSSSGTVKEGGTTTLTITRNTDTTRALTVTLSSDYDDNLTYSHTVTIPAGQKSETVKVTSKANDVSGDSHTVVFTVAANGYSSGTCYIMITDQTLPDARISSFTANLQEAMVNEEAKLTMIVSNDGAAELPAGVAIKVYHRGESMAITTLYTQNTISVGGSETLTKSIVLPATVGNQKYYAVVNEDHKVNELSYTNNTSSEMVINTTAPFTVTVNTDKKVYKQGDKVTITGQLTGKNTSETDIDIYLINEGVHQVKTVKTDLQGSFSYDWELYTLQSGHFSVGACYPNEGQKTEMTAFDVYGLRRTSTEYIKCDVDNGSTFTGSLDIINPSNLDLTGVTVDLISAPINCNATFTIPSHIKGGETVKLSYSLKGLAQSSEIKWDEVKARINTAEGISLEVILYYYCRNTTGKLESMVKNINTTMTKSKSREYILQVTNIGRGNTGNITLALPDFIKSLGGNNLPSIDQNDTLNIALSLTPTADMQLNVPVTGQIGINCANGDGTAVSFSITPVSDETGTLTIDVCDEYTYYTNEAPHVSNAEVVVRNPVTNALVTQGKTGIDGKYSAILPEGYYKVIVTANKHNSYTNIVSVDPGTETVKTINLSVESITVDWKVKEVEIEDEYEIVTTVKYETNVPTPVVELIVPQKLDIESVADGESIIFNAILTNKGLIKAEYAELILPTGFKYLTFEPLTEYQGLTIAPQQSIIIPVKVTRRIPSGSRLLRVKPIDNDPCAAQPGTLYYWDCGTDRKWHKYWVAMQVGSCDSNDPSTWGDNDNWGGGSSETPGSGPDGGPGGGGFSPYGSSSTSRNLSTEDTGCNPCQNKAAVRFLQCGTSFIPIYGCIQGVVHCGKNIFHDKKRDWRTWVGCLSSVVGCIPHPIGWVANGIGCAISMTEPCEYEGADSRRRLYTNRSASTPSFIKEFQEILPIPIKEAQAFLDYSMEIMGDSIWLNCNKEELERLLIVLSSSKSISIKVEDYLEFKPAEITLQQFSTFIERLNNTPSQNIITENYINLDKIDYYLNSIGEAESMSKLLGFSSTEDLWDTTYGKYENKIQEASSSVCTSITLQIKQTMAMTRQAFRGTLTVFNGNETIAMTDMKLTLNVTNRTSGIVANSHEFQINAESLDGFTGDLDLTSGWTLAANSTGTATILFIPTKFAAPTEPTEWSFGGTLSYVDPFTGLEVTRELYPVTLTVKPSPELDLTYFMQRDIYGDDPLTLDVVEPMVPAEFALLINNKGNGDATNVRMVTQQPEIIDNEKGLYIDFEIVSSQVNGGDANLAFGKSIANDFGTIPAHSQSYAQWWLTSTLLGHFTEYDIKANHVTSYGNEELSLLGDVTIHEMIRSLDLSTDSKKMVGFLVNDLTDAEDLPDMLYLSNGETATVSIASGSQMTKLSGSTYNLTITPSEMGWTYGSILDPTQGMSELKSIVRQRDGKEINLRNFWQTDRTLRDGKDPLYEHRIHFADEFVSTAPETYLLTFDPLPNVVLKVESIGGVPKERTVAEEPVNQVTVKFNKKIVPDTFSPDDITFAVQGAKKDTKLIGISTVDNENFKLDLATLTEQCPNGYYTMTVQTADITDFEGYQGKNGKQANWILFRGGLVQLLTSAWPENSGIVTRKQDEEATARKRATEEGTETTAKYGSTVVLVANASKGYEFANWTLNGEVVSNKPEYEALAISDLNIVANFTKKTYQVNIESESEGGIVTGTATGIYEYGTPLNLTAVPGEDYVFKHWTVNGEAVASDDGSLSLNVDAELNIKPVFIREYYRQTMTFARGWNWLSSYLNDSFRFDDLQNYVKRIIGPTEEFINDPQNGITGNLTELTPGKTYKLEATRLFSNTFRGHLFDTEVLTFGLQKGWNWIGYPYPDQNALDKIIMNATEGDYIASQTGFAEFSEGNWSGSLDTFVPGNGYLYKSVTEKNLTFNLSSVASQSHDGSNKSVTNVNAYDGIIDIHRYPNTMNMTIQLVRNGTILSPEDYNIYAWAGEELRGFSKSVDDRFYLTVYGEEPVEISFTVELKATGDTFKTQEIYGFKDDVVGSRKNPFVIDPGNADGIDIIGSNERPMTVYNMQGILVSRDATLKAIRRLPQGIYIINGQKYNIK